MRYHIPSLFLRPRASSNVPYLNSRKFHVSNFLKLDVTGEDLNKVNVSFEQVVVYF